MGVLFYISKRRSLTIWIWFSFFHKFLILNLLVKFGEWWWHTRTILSWFNNLNWFLQISKVSRWSCTFNVTKWRIQHKKNERLQFVFKFLKFKLGMQQNCCHDVKRKKEKKKRIVHGSRYFFCSIFWIIIVTLERNIPWKR